MSPLTKIVTQRVAEYIVKKAGLYRPFAQTYSPLSKNPLCYADFIKQTTGPQSKMRDLIGIHYFTRYSGFIGVPNSISLGPGFQQGLIYKLMFMLC